MLHPMLLFKTLLLLGPLKVQEWKVFQNKFEIVHYLWAEKTESELFFQI